MSETVQVGRFKDGTDPVTGDPTRVLDVERYSGKARIRWASREVSNSDSTSSPVGSQEPYLSVPFGSPRVWADDEVHITASPDPLLVDRQFRIQGAAVAGQVTAYRYPLTELG
ncbi:hypothetical protein QFZ21_001812 [Microbacterium sp. W4I20]|nr:hypothetical protein [Microbacterium sp. W4I20]